MEDTLAVDDSLNSIVDESLLRSMLDESEDFELRRRIRSRLRELKKLNPDSTDGPPPKTSPSSGRPPGVVRPRETWAVSSSTVAGGTGTKRDGSPAGRSAALKSQPFKAGPTSFLPKTTGNDSSAGGLGTVSLRSVTGVTKDHQQKTTDESKLEMQSLSLRSVGTGGSKLNPSETEKKGEFLAGVSLRKVDQIKISVTDASDSTNIRHSARSAMSAKAARVHFQEIDAATAALTVGDSGDESGIVRSRSPSPNRLRQAMLDWCHYRTNGYKNVDIYDFSASWSDGLAFCALVHSFFPDAFNFDELDKSDVRANFQLAFDTAQNLGGVCPLLDPDDLVEAGTNLESKSVFMYVNSIYATLSAPSKSKDMEPHSTTPKDEPDRENIEASQNDDQ